MKRNNNDTLLILKSLIEYLKYYDLLKNRSTNRSRIIKEINDSIDCINYLGYKSHLPLLLKFIKTTKGFNQDFLEAIKYVEAIQFLFQNVSEGALPQVIKNFFYSLMWQLNDKRSLSKINALLKKKLTELKQNNSDRLSRLTLLRAKKNGVIYLLFRVLKKNAGSNITELDIKKFDKTLEHIMPQTMNNGVLNLRKEWFDIVKNDLAKDSIVSRETNRFLELDDKLDFYYKYYIQSIGNMLILAHADNSSLSDKGFKEKKSVYRDIEKNNYLTKNILRQRKWNAEKIRENGLFISKKYLDIFK